MAVVEGSPTVDPNESGPASEEDSGGMTVWEHLAELRVRLIISFVALIVATIAAFFIYNPVLSFITSPYRLYEAHHHLRDITKGNLVLLSPLEGFSTRLKVSGYLGLALASPVWLWELWRFITPGLHKREKRYAVPFVGCAIVLFAMGVTASILVFPRALNFLINVGGSNVAPLFSPSRYVSLYVVSCLIFGGVFLYPILLVFLELSGVVPSRRWRHWRRQAIVVMCIVAAVVTPSNDPFSFLAMAIPLYVFYEISILIGRIAGK